MIYCRRVNYFEDRVFLDVYKRSFFNSFSPISYCMYKKKTHCNWYHSTFGILCHQVAHISESPRASSAAAVAHKLCQLLVVNIFGV